MFLENEGGGEDAVDGLEVEREVHAVGGEGAQEVDVIGVRENGAEPGEEEDPQPVEMGRRKKCGEASGIEQREGGEADGSGTDHFPADHGQGVAAACDDGAVEHGKNGGEKCTEQGDSEP